MSHHEPAFQQIPDRTAYPSLVNARAAAEFSDCERMPFSKGDHRSKLGVAKGKSLPEHKQCSPADKVGEVDQFEGNKVCENRLSLPRFAAFLFAVECLAHAGILLTALAYSTGTCSRRTDEASVAPRSQIKPANLILPERAKSQKAVPAQAI